MDLNSQPTKPNQLKDTKIAWFYKLIDPMNMSPWKNIKTKMAEIRYLALKGGLGK
jgi:hypothetical protein